MLPRFNVSSSYGHRVAGAHLRQTRTVQPGTSKQHQRGTHVIAASRQPTVFASCRLVLRPTGDGSSEHIGEKVPQPGAIPLQEGVYEVGRSSPADIQIPIPTVSSRHALLRVEADRVCVTDLNSTNGTVVNGQELGPLDNAEVAIGGEVIFGDVFLARYCLDKLPDSSSDSDAVPPQSGGGSNTLTPSS